MVVTKKKPVRHINKPISKSSEKIFNIPNSLSFLRILISPIFAWAILESHHLLALILGIVAALSDFLDGFLARKLNMQSTFGQLLDPVADKVFMFLSVIALLLKFHFPMWLGITILGRDVLLMLGSMLFFKNNNSKKLSPLIIGKVSTVFQMTTIVVFIVSSISGKWSIWIELLLYSTFIITIISGIAYLVRAVKILKN
jgi:cardiolipin synthase